MFSYFFSTLAFKHKMKETTPDQSPLYRSNPIRRVKIEKFHGINQN